MSHNKQSSYLSSNLEFLNRLSHQILEFQEESRKRPCVKISLEEKHMCESYKKSHHIMVEATAIKSENVNVSSDSNNFGCQETITPTVPIINDCRSESEETCKLCKCRNSLVESCNFKFLSVGDYEHEVLQTIFHEPIETGYQLMFCERCFQSISYLQTCYLKYKEAQHIYEETMLRLRYFKKCANEMTLSSNFNNSHDFPLDDDNDNFEESWECNLITDVKMDTQSSNEGEETLPAKQIKTCSKRAYRQKYNYKGTPIQRQGGLTNEQYQEHRRLQMRQYYLEKKKKLGKVESGELPTSVVKRVKVRKKKIGVEENTTNSKPVDTSSSLVQSTVDCLLIKNNDDSNQFEEEFEELNPGTAKKDSETSNQGVKSKKKKYNYKGRNIRRRGGLTEEQYQEHRRTQSANYYFEKKKKLGKLTFGPKLLNPVDRAKLERAEKVSFDSNNLPAKSSWGARVPVVQIDGKRFTYRNVEFTKYEDGTYRCGKCCCTTQVLNVLKKHIAKIHFDKERGYKCSYCDKSFYYQYQLKYHEGSHTTKGAGIQCEECGKSFKYPAGYYFHRRSVHQGIKPHECRLCQKHFGTKKDLRKHMESISHRSKENDATNNATNNKTEKESLNSH